MKTKLICNKCGPEEVCVIYTRDGNAPSTHTCSDAFFRSYRRIARHPSMDEKCSLCRDKAAVVLVGRHGNEISLCTTCVKETLKQIDASMRT